MRHGLNIGCGTKHLGFMPDGSGDISWLNVDNRNEVNPDMLVDLVRTWPWAGATFDIVNADNVLEHFYPENAIHVLNEIGRVLKIGGEAVIIVPHALSQGAYQDPTHKSFWVPRSALYWSNAYTQHGGRAVGITANLVKIFEPYVYGDPATEQFIRFHMRKDS